MSRLVEPGIVSLLATSLLRTLIGVIPAAFLAGLLYHYSIFDLGLPLLAFFINLLVMGWAIGLLVSAIILRYGLGAESLAWLAIFAIAPLSGIYYPVAVLPDWLEPLAYALPSSHVFEGMRAVMFDQSFRWDHLAWAIGLNMFYLGGSIAVFLAAFRIARIRGLLLQIGE